MTKAKLFLMMAFTTLVLAACDNQLEESFEFLI